VNKSNKLHPAIAAVFAFCCAPSIASADQSTVIGPVEKVDLNGSSIVILGQRYKLASARSTELTSSLSVRGVPVGSFVVAKGERLEGGDFQLESLKRMPASYVPGASQIYLHGSIDSVDYSLGIVRVGALEIQISQASLGQIVSSVPGDGVELVGIQASPGGMVWATHVQFSVTSVQGIEGTGKNASMQGIEGTGKATLQGIEGTGKNASTQGIEGTGKATLQGIEGTGKNASMQGIEGTGKVTLQGIEGTGKQL